MTAANKALPRQDRLGAGIAMGLGAFFCFTMVDSSAKWLVAAGLSAFQVAFVRYVMHLLVSLALFWPTEGRALFQSNAPGLQVARALTLAVGTTLNFFALAYLPLTVTTAIFFAGPILVCLLAVPMLGERIGVHRIGAVLVGFGGVLIVVQPWGADFHPAMFLSLGALMAAALYFVLTRKIAGRDDNPTGQVITSAVPALLLIPFVLTGWVWPTAPVDWLVALAIGVFAAVGHSLLTVASRYAEASVIAPLVYVQIVYVTAISWAVFGQPPEPNTLAGAAVIIASGLYIWWRERRARPR